MLKPKSSSWKSILLLSAIGGGFATAVACSTGPKSTRAPSSSPPASAATDPDEPTAPKIPNIIDVADMKNGQGGRPSVDPCEDFYQFSCGAWIDRTEIPADKKGVNRQVTAASDATDVTLNRILVAYGRGDFTIASKYALKLSDFYNACLTADNQTPQSLIAIKRQIAMIRTARSQSDRARLVARLKLMGVSTLFDFYSEQDPANSTKVVGMVAQGGMGLPNRDFYFDQDAKSVETREKYRAYIAQLFTLLGETPVHAEQIAKDVFDFEALLADKAFGPTDLRDILKNNHPTNQAGLKKMAPHFDWNTYFSTLGGPKTNDLNVKVPQFITAEDKILQTTSPGTLQNYFIFQLVDGLSSQLGSGFAAADFDFHGKFLTGAKERAPLWKRCTQSVAANLGYPLSDAYVQTFEGEKIRERTESMIAEIKKSFTDNLVALNSGSEAWIDDNTVKGAREKVGKISQKVGAPTKIPDYSSVQTTSLTYLQNSIQRCGQFEVRNGVLRKSVSHVDKSEWSMMPWHD